MAGRVSRADAARWAARGVGTLPPEVALETLDELLASAEPQQAVLAMRWERFLERSTEAGPHSLSGFPLKPTYTPSDIEPFDYERDIGNPGDFPFTRGVHETMTETDSQWQMVMQDLSRGSSTNAGPAGRRLKPSPDHRSLDQL